MSPSFCSIYGRQMYTWSFFNITSYTYLTCIFLKTKREYKKIPYIDIRHWPGELLYSLSIPGIPFPKKALHYKTFIKHKAWYINDYNTLKHYETLPKESTGFEPARRCYRFAGFRVRCITTLPTLHNSINYIKFKQKFNLFLVVDTKKQLLTSPSIVIPKNNPLSQIEIRGYTH